MLGWFSAAAAWASARNRRRNDSSWARAAWSTLTATRRRSLRSSPRKTCADAPEPIGASRRYRPPSIRPTWSTMRDVAICPRLPEHRRRLGDPRGVGGADRAQPEWPHDRAWFGQRLGPDDGADRLAGRLRGRHAAPGRDLVVAGGGGRRLRRGGQPARRRADDAAP